MNNNKKRAPKTKIYTAKENDTQKNNEKQHTQITNNKIKKKKRNETIPFNLFMGSIA